ncbi:hypothetical protein [Ferrimicrobium acidiphilum]|jgi:hypothetical protein|uniref:hypothetical protein n=1 Tax=Ferrimicrobium acidiphilum TaxID=121039 RepID=UPI0023F0B8D2|nr:hypothetical protein [Ferrimicrobium acidiphilum]
MHQDIQIATEALRDAQEYRAKWMMRISAGEASVFDVILAAKQPYAEALYKIRLESLLALDPLVNRRRQLILQRTVDLTYYGKRVLNLNKLSVGWLLSPRYKSSFRLDTFVDAYLTFAKIGDSVTERFPWTY